MSAPEGAGTLITAPFTADQVLRLNAYQSSRSMHPFTCGWRWAHENEEAVRLVATRYGWVCPRRCLYTQDWAHAWMAIFPEILRGVTPVAPAGRP